MDDIGPAVALVVLVGFATAGGVYTIADMADVPERQLIKACEDKGYWQYEQTRVLCSVEKTTKGETP